MGNREYSPIEISAMILTYVRNFASEAMGEDIKQFLGKKTEFAINPDYAVAEGAAI